MTERAKTLDDAELRLVGIDALNKALGPEMKSTGESILFIEDLKDDQFYDLYSRRKMYLTK